MDEQSSVLIYTLLEYFAHDNFAIIIIVLYLIAYA